MKNVDIKGGMLAFGTIVFTFLLFLCIQEVRAAGNDMVWGGSLYQDPKASRIGDLLTVLIMEDSKASQASTTERGKQAGVDFTSSGALDKLPQLSANGQTSYKGDLKTNRTTAVKATVTATVTSIYPNGNLLIEGQKNATVNGEILEVSVKGVVRPMDIQSGNVINSDYIADSHIVYKGVKEKGFWSAWAKVLTFPFRLLEPLF
jgi:flagellar L-ring protein precursor FlgH